MKSKLVASCKTNEIELENGCQTGSLDCSDDIPEEWLIFQGKGSVSKCSYVKSPLSQLENSSLNTSVRSCRLQNSPGETVSLKGVKDTSFVLNTAEKRKPSRLGSPYSGQKSFPSLKPPLLCNMRYIDSGNVTPGFGFPSRKISSPLASLSLIQNTTTTRFGPVLNATKGIASQESTTKSKTKSATKSATKSETSSATKSATKSASKSAKTFYPIQVGPAVYCNSPTGRRAPGVENMEPSVVRKMRFSFDD